MALNCFPNANVYELNQCGGGGASGDVQKISPVESVTDQAKYQVKCKQKRSISATSGRGSIIKSVHKRKKVGKQELRPLVKKVASKSHVQKESSEEIKFLRIEFYGYGGINKSSW
jgi:uncharacterized protein (DUF2344 family)